MLPTNNIDKDDASRISGGLGLDHPKILLEAEIVRITRLSAVTIWRMERKGLFPLRIKLGAKRIGWLDSEVRAWLAARVSERRAAA